MSRRASTRSRSVSSKGSKSESLEISESRGLSARARLRDLKDQLTSISEVIIVRTRTRLATLKMLVLNFRQNNHGDGLCSGSFDRCVVEISAGNEALGKGCEICLDIPDLASIVVMTRGQVDFDVELAKSSRVAVEVGRGVLLRMGLT